MAKVRPWMPVRFSGRIDQLVFCTRGDITYLRQYVKARDAKTPAQLQRRSRFREAVAGWRALSEVDRMRYRDRARLSGRTGYNLYLSETLAKE